MLRAYYRLAKPGIVYGNALHIIAGALLAAQFGFSWRSFIGVLVGTSLVIASACVANNLLDRDIDAQMRRTKQRPSVTGEVSLRSAVAYSLIMFLLGVGLLSIYTNALVVSLAFLAYGMYVVVYGYAKRTTTWSTVVGSVPGALPAMAGYVAFSGELTIGSWLVFMLVAAWQMPHFYAIALFRQKEYEAAQLPVLSTKVSERTVRRHMLVWQVGYILSLGGLMTIGILSLPVAGVLLLSASLWLVHALQIPNSYIPWARKSFGISLQLALLMVVMSAVNVVLT